MIVLWAMILLSNCSGIDSKVFDTNNDGMISVLKAKTVKEIDCSNRNIKDLTGIEKFENLERLICSNNPEVAAGLGNPIDVNKCKFDEGKTNFIVSFVL